MKLFFLYQLGEGTVELGIKYHKVFKWKSSTYSVCMSFLCVWFMRYLNLNCNAETVNSWLVLPLRIKKQREQHKGNTFFNGSNLFEKWKHFFLSRNMWSQVLGGISLGSICESVLPINLCTLTLPGMPLTPLFQMLKGSINVHWKEVGQMSNTSPFLGSDWIFWMFCFDITIILILETCSVGWMTRPCLYYLFSFSIFYMVL